MVFFSPTLRRWSTFLEKTSIAMAATNNLTICPSEAVLWTVPTTCGRVQDPLPIMDRGVIPQCRLYWCFIKFIDWRYSQSCWYFRPLLWTVAPLLFLWPPLPLPPPSQSKHTVYRQCVAVGVLSCVVGHILHEFNTQYRARFRTYKIATPPQTKTPVKTTFRDWCLYSPFIHAPRYYDWTSGQIRSAWMWYQWIGLD